MLTFILRRLATMVLTALTLSFVVFWLTNLPPNLEKLARSEGSVRMTDEAVQDWLAENGFAQPLIVRYGEWLGVAPGWTGTNDDGRAVGRCVEATEDGAAPTRFCGVLQGWWGFSSALKEPVSAMVAEGLGRTGILMFWVMLVMVPGALLIGILAGMREGSRLDRGLSTASIITTATPEYVSSVILISLFASPLIGLQIFNGSANSAMDDITFVNFTLPVLTIALYGMGYIARMTRASMTEVMTAQYIRTARLKGVSFRQVVVRHALRNALIAPFTVIMLQFPWLLNGVVIVETLFNYKGFGWLLVEAAGNNDIDLLLGVSVISVLVVLITQLISDIGYVYLNPRIRLS
jgi:peptide/nickel transport system permease protein